jgi:hypothetical protein
MLWLLDPISVENRIWRDGNGTVLVRCRRFKALYGVMLEACG